MYRLSDLSFASHWANSEPYELQEEALCFSPDGSRVVLYNYDYRDVLIIRNATDGRFLGAQTLPYNRSSTNYVYGLEARYAPDGHTLYIAGMPYDARSSSPTYASYGAFAAVWDTEGGSIVNHELVPIDGTAGHPFAVGISPNVQQVILAGLRYDGSLAPGAGFLARYNTSDFSTPLPVAGHGSFASSVAYAPNGQFVASASEDGTARLWRASDGAQISILRHGVQPLSSVVISPDSSLVASASGSITSGGDGSVKIWRVSDGALLTTIPAAGASCYSLAFSPDGATLLATYSSQTTLRGVAYRVSDGAALNSFSDPNSIFTVVYSPDGSKFACIAYQGYVTVYNVHTFQAITSFWGPSGGNVVIGLAFSPDGNTVAVGGASYYGQNAIALHDATTGALRQILTGHEYAVFGLAFSPDGKYLLSGGADAKLRIWRLSDSSLAQEYDLETGVNGAWAGGGAGVRSVAYSSNGQYLVYGCTDSPVVLAKNPFWAAPAPTVNDQSVSLRQDTSLAITLTAADTTGTPLTFAVTTPPTHGTLSGTGANLTYTPNAGYVGTDSFSFTAANGYGGVSQPATVNITVKDAAPPIITLNGGNLIIVSVGSTFIDPGATATDNVDGSVPVVVSGSVNTSVPGTYTLTYTATDAVGNTATTTRTVTVVDATPPVITLNGTSSMSVNQGATFTDPGATATDNVDGSVPVVVSGSVNTSVPGTYALTYTATDAAGNTATATRTVVVNAVATGSKVVIVAKTVQSAGNKVEVEVSVINQGTLTESNVVITSATLIGVSASAIAPGALGDLVAGAKTGCHFRFLGLAKGQSGLLVIKGTSSQGAFTSSQSVTIR